MDIIARLFSAALTVSASVENPAPAAAALIETEFAQISPETAARRAEAWLISLDTLRARFVQIAPDNVPSTGIVEIDRPGRARFDYDDPSPVLVVADGATIAIADFALETLDRTPIGATPLRFLLGRNPDLAGSGVVVHADRHDGRLHVTMEDPGGEAEGQLTLVFDDPQPDAGAETMMLAGWYVTDALGGLTEVSLLDVETGIRINPRRFILDEEDITRDTRRRRGR